MAAKPQRRVATTSSLPAPTMGINDLDSFASMPPDYCIDLLNFFPSNGALSTRQGYKEWATNLGGRVYTMINFAMVDGTSELFACTNEGIWDVTSSTDAPVMVVALTYGAVEYCQYSNIAGNYLVVTNGVDAALLYDGTTWTPFTTSDTPTNPGEIKGVDPATLTGVTSYKGRLWFIEQDSLTAWYLPYDSVGGEAQPFYLGGSLPRGGGITEIITWSLDSGAGMDDKVCFYSNQGELLIYTGNDPTDATDWQLESMFFISAPIGTSPSMELGGDVILLTRNGIIPLSSVVKGEASIAVSNSALSKRISRTMNRIVNSGTFVPDWEIMNLPSLQAILVIVPPTSTSSPRQYVMNSLTGAWTRFDLPARCGTLHQGKFFFGDDNGRVLRYGDTFTDGDLLDGTPGAEITCYAFTAYNYFGDPTTNKHFKLVRPIFQGTTPPGYLLKLNMDYDLASLPGNPPSPEQGSGDAFWDAALWDNAFWRSSGTVYRPWVGVTGLGFCAALLIKVISSETSSFTAIETVYEAGSAI